MKRILIIFISILITLILIELTWRLYLYKSGKGFFDDPNEFTSSFFTTYDEPMPKITQAGFYYHNGFVSRDKRDGEYRIIAFGGSTTVNARAKIRFTDILEKKFNDSGYNTRILNAGGEAYSSAHTLVNFALRNLDVQPNAIIVYHNINDVSANWIGGDVSADYSNKYLLNPFLGVRHRIGITGEIIKVSRFLRFIFSKLALIKYMDFKQNFDRDFSEGLVYFERNLNNITRIAYYNDISVFLLSQPARSDFKFNVPFNAYNKVVEKVAKNNPQNAVFIDLFKHIDKDIYFEDSLHYTKQGVREIAERLYLPILKEYKEQVYH